MASDMGLPSNPFGETQKSKICVGPGHSGIKGNEELNILARKES